MAAALDAQPLQHPRDHLPPPQPQQPFNRASTCHRHPDQPVTGFCASCLRERLEGLDTANRHLSSSSASSSASAALKSLFFRPAVHHPNHRNADAAAVASSSSKSSTLLPELRRCKSFSGRPPAPFLSAVEPQRKSCDVRVRNTLWSLFHLDDGGSAAGGDTSNPFPPPLYSVPANAGGGEIEVEVRSRRLDPIVAATVIESGEEEEEEEEEEEDQREEQHASVRVGMTTAAVVETGKLGEGDEIRPADRPALAEDIVGDDMVGEELTIKDHIDLNAHSKKPPPKDLKEIAGSFWLAASVFSKKLQKWRRKQKLKKHEAAAAAGGGSSKCPAAGIRSERPFFRSRRRFSRDTQSELAEDAFGRRSCDTDPRYSLDAGRMSLDDPRFSLDEPRASWDGYLTGVRPVAPRQPPMLSVMEDAPVAAPPAVQRLDGEIPVEEDCAIPGGSSQTRDYYLDSSQRRRRSLDRSFSIRRSSFEGDELLPKSMPNIIRSSSPTGISTEYFHLVDRFEREYRDPASSLSAREGGRSESFDSAGFRETVNGGGNPKKSRRWSKAWSLWGLIHRRSRGRGVGASVAERSFSESWPELRRDGHNGQMLRCSSTVSSRLSFKSSGGIPVSGGARRNGLEINGQGKKRTGEFVLERNRSARFSPGRAADNGMLRFYLTPMRSSSRRGSIGPGKAHQAIHPHSFTRSMLQLY